MNLGKVVLDHPNHSCLVHNVAVELEYMQTLNKIPYRIEYGYNLDGMNSHYMAIYYKNIGGCE